MRLSPLQLQRSYFSDVVIRSNPNAKEEDRTRIELDIKVNAVCPAATALRTWFVFLDIKISPQPGVMVPYTGEISVMGHFTVDDKWPETQLEKLVYINGAGILYCASRELISTITAKGYYPELLLPGWSFFDMYRELEEKRKREAQPELRMGQPAPSEPATPAKTE